MHAYCIVSSIPQIRQDQVQKLLESWDAASIDQVILAPEEENTIGIEIIRNFIPRLWNQPVGGNVLVGILYDAQLLTPQAQQALLKTLEEPPVHTKIILTADNETRLLPTILSRVEVIRLPPASAPHSDLDTQVKTDVMQLIGASAGKRRILVDRIAPNRETATRWLTQAIELLYAEVQLRYASRPTKTIDIPTPEIVTALRHLTLAEKYLAANVTPKLVLDMFFET